MRRNVLTLVFALMMTAGAFHAGAFYSNGPREEMNLVGKDWQEAIADTLDMGKIPDNLSWQDSELPHDSPAEVSQLFKKLKSADTMWQYCMTIPSKCFNEDGTFKIKEKQSAWYRKNIDVPEELLKNHTVHLTLAGASYRSSVIVNGKLAGGSIQSALPLDFDITKFVVAGKNELAIGITTREGIIDQKAQAYIAPSMGVMPGIRGPVKLEFRPLIAVDDVFVKTSVKDKNVDFQITVKNSGDKEAEVIPHIKVHPVRDPNTVVGEFSGASLKLASGAEGIVNVKENWMAPVLWAPEHPELYFADVSLTSGGNLVDSYRQNFGFREFSISGKDFLLNGKRIVLLRESKLDCLRTVEETPDPALIFHKGSPFNSFRQHLGTCNMNQIHRANQQGIMVIPESAYSWTIETYSNNPEKAKVWLPGVLEYYRQWARQMRNEPSVVIYSLTNETFWARNIPEEMAVAKQIVDVMKKEDPTRPLQGDGENSWNGLLDIINIHYPEGSCGTVRTKYVNSGFAMPNDAEWLTNEGGNGWNSKFAWDRPLVIGEFGNGLGDSPDFVSAVGGDNAYNLAKRGKASRDQATITDKGMDDCNINTSFKLINRYRHIGVAGLNPWPPGGDREALIKAMTVVPLDYHPNAESGGIFKRKLAVFNDGYRPLSKIMYKFSVNGDTVCDKELPLNVVPGQKWDGIVEIPVPNIASAAKAEFSVRLMQENVEVDHYTETVYVVPSMNLDKLVKNIAVIDPGNSLKSVFAKLHLDNIDKVQGGTIPDGKKLLVIGVDAYKADMNPMLDKFVENGGVVLMLPQKNWRPYRDELPERDLKHAATQSWIRTPGHPVFKNMESAQFNFWMDDNIISYETFRKPTHGPLKALLDCGGAYGLIWSPLMEVPIGKGAFLMTTLELAAKDDPAARQLMGNLVEYGCERKPENHEKLNLLAGKNTVLTDALKLVGVQCSEGIGESGPVLLDATAEFDVAELRKALGQGRTVWLHGFTQETFPKVAPLLPAGSSLKEVPKGSVEAMPISTDELVRGTTNFDFAWYIAGSWRGPKSVIAKTGDWVLDTNAADNGVTQLTNPAFMVKIDSGKGKILFDTLQWENAIGKITDKALRVASGILTNLGCEFKFAKKVDYNYSYVDLKKFANMAYMDSKADDGVGGWTDQGRNDMRFFLINHSGTMGGEEGGAAIPVPPFPTEVDFLGTPYVLIDPKANNNKAVLSFGSSTHGTKLPREAGPIPVNAKMDKLWMLHASCWTVDKPGTAIAEYTVEYEDGSKTTIPIRLNIDIGDWFAPKEFANAKVAWDGNNLTEPLVGFNVMPWTNPHPEKMIKTFSVKAGLGQSQYVLIAITCGVTRD